MPTDFRLLSGAGRATQPEIVALGRPVGGRGSTDRDLHRGDLTVVLKSLVKSTLPQGQTSALPAMTGRQRLFRFVS